MINKTILSAALVASMSFAPFVFAQVQSVTPKTTEGELDIKAGSQGDTRMLDRSGEGHPDELDHPDIIRAPRRGRLFE